VAATPVMVRFTNKDITVCLLMVEDPTLDDLPGTRFWRGGSRRGEGDDMVSSCELMFFLVQWVARPRTSVEPCLCRWDGEDQVCPYHGGVTTCEWWRRRGRDVASCMSASPDTTMSPLPRARWSWRTHHHFDPIGRRSARAGDNTAIFFVALHSSKHLTHN
jgi:hypothetical protein